MNNVAGDYRSKVKRSHIKGLQTFPSYMVQAKSLEANIAVASVVKIKKSKIMTKCAAVDDL